MVYRLGYYPLHVDQGVWEEENGWYHFLLPSHSTDKVQKPFSVHCTVRCFSLFVFKYLSLHHFSSPYLDLSKT